MRENKVLGLLREGKVPLGTMVFEFSTPGLPRIAAAAGADYVILDTEHSGWGLDTVRAMLAASRAADLTPIVRLPALRQDYVSRALDQGAMGLMVPMIEAAEEAERLVQFAKYPPRGRRGAAFGIAHDDFAPGDVKETMRSANAETLLIALVESARGIEAIDAIAAVDGIDIVWLGQYDLSLSLGIPGEFEHPKLLAAVDRLLAACKAAHKPVGYGVATPAEGAAAVRRGFGCIAYGSDIALYQRALRDGIDALRTAAPPS